MDLSFTVGTRINKPVSDVFNAVVDDKKLVGYFANKSTGPLKEGDTITWKFTNSSCSGECDVMVKKLVPNKMIVFEWKVENADYNTTATISFESLEKNKTLIKITETGWREDETGLKGSYGNCEGWQHMAMCLKGYLEYNLDLRR